MYKEVVGVNEPFDCAVCLCEFSENDKLRLLPTCSHVFHIQNALSRDSCMSSRRRDLGYKVGDRHELSDGIQIWIYVYLNWIGVCMVAMEASGQLW
ncbi:putative transcription factor C2H2 family [Helianthus anomalus]